METETVSDPRTEVNLHSNTLATSVLSVESSLLYLIGNLDDSVGMWKKLVDQFQKKMWANKLTLRRSLYSLNRVS